MKDNFEYVAYEGAFFSAEWFYDEKGESESLDFFYQQSPSKKRKILNLIRLICDAGVIRDIKKFRNEGEKIYAFKPQPDRYLCFFTDNRKIIITSAFTKKTNKMPKSEKEKALKRKKSYLKRLKERLYYEK